MYEEIRPCLWCSQGLRYVEGRGWTHLGGGIYFQRCPRCRWQWTRWPALDFCVRCDTPMADDHVGVPVEQPLRVEELRELLRASA